VRTAFGRAGPKGIFWRTRADDMAVKVVRELLRRNPQLPPERIGDVAFAAGVPVHELASEGTSLEEVFLQLTSETEEAAA
jgi:acetyl-CoA acetyltransferase